MAGSRRWMACVSCRTFTGLLSCTQFCARNIAQRADRDVAGQNDDRDLPAQLLAQRPPSAAARPSRSADCSPPGSGRAGRRRAASGRAPQRRRRPAPRGALVLEQQVQQVAALRDRPRRPGSCRCAVARPSRHPRRRAAPVRPLAPPDPVPARPRWRRPSPGPVASGPAPDVPADRPAAARSQGRSPRPRLRSRAGLSS